MMTAPKAMTEQIAVQAEVDARRGHGPIGFPGFSER